MLSALVAAAVGSQALPLLAQLPGEGGKRHLPRENGMQALKEVRQLFGWLYSNLIPGEIA